MAAGHSAEAADFNTGQPQHWAPRKGIHTFAVAPDGKRLAILEAENSGRIEMSPIMFLSDFLDHLRKRVPSRGEQKGATFH